MALLVGNFGYYFWDLLNKKKSIFMRKHYIKIEIQYLYGVLINRKL